MFKLFDEDGNGNISIDELLNMMAFFIELGMDTGNVDMAKTMAEVFSLGDINKDLATTVRRGTRRVNILLQAPGSR